MRNLFVVVTLVLWSSFTHADIVKSLAKDRMADLDKLVAADSKVLMEMRNPSANTTLLTRDQNIRYLKLIEKSKSTFGDDPLSPQGSCVKALLVGHEVWQSKVAYQKSKSNFDKDSVSMWQKKYASERKECEVYIRKLH